MSWAFLPDSLSTFSPEQCPGVLQASSRGTCSRRPSRASPPAKRGVMLPAPPGGLGSAPNTLITVHLGGPGVPSGSGSPVIHCLFGSPARVWNVIIALLASANDWVLVLAQDWKGSFPGLRQVSPRACPPSSAAHSLVCFSCTNQNSNFYCLKPTICSDSDNYCVTVSASAGIGECWYLLLPGSGHR